MNICSLVVHTRPAMLATVRQTLDALPGVEVHGGSDEGKLIVTVEEADDDRLKTTLVNINQLEGVLNVAVAYHHEEDDQSMDEEVFSEADKA